MALRKYVKVNALFDEEGKVTPQSLIYNDRSILIDRVLDRRQACALKAGGQGMRYTIRIGEHITFLFEEDSGRWFVEENKNVR